MTPAFSIFVDGGDITGKLQDRLIRIQLIEYDGHESDSLEIVLDDRDFAVEAPSSDAPLSLSLGYRETGLVFKGLFMVDEVEVDGPPFTMKIHAKAADQLSAQKQHRTLAYQNKTLGAIVQQIAGRYGLTPGISSDLSSVQYDYVNQTEESDWHFLTRLAKENDALFSIKNGHLIFVSRASNTSMSGLAMPKVIVTYPGNLIRYRAMAKDRPRHKKSKAAYHDLTTGQVVIEDADGSDGSAEFMVRHLQPNKTQAKNSAQAKQNSLDRAQGEVNVEIEGDPSVTPQGIMLCQTGRTILDGEWEIKQVTNNLENGSGFRTWIAGGAKPSKPNKHYAKPTRVQRF